MLGFATLASDIPKLEECAANGGACLGHDEEEDEEMYEMYLVEPKHPLANTRVYLVVHDQRDEQPVVASLSTALSGRGVDLCAFCEANHLLSSLLTSLHSNSLTSS